MKLAAEIMREGALAKHTDCIPWPLSLNRGGYGQLRVEGAMTEAHRAACEVKHGPPPFEGAEAAHSCHNRPCFNGNHLSWKTRKANQEDRVKDGTYCADERHGACKVPNDHVVAIRAATGRVADIAESFGISVRYCYKIRAGERRAGILQRV